MGLLNSLFGYRWSLYVVLGDKGLVYAMHSNCVIGMLGYIVGYYERGLQPKPPWSLHLNFNKRHQSFQLEPSHFEDSGISMDLLARINAIDPRFDVEFSDPIFVEVATRRKLPVNVDVEKMLAHINDYEPEEEVTFFSVMNEVFGS